MANDIFMTWKPYASGIGSINTGDAIYEQRNRSKPMSEKIKRTILIVQITIKKKRKMREKEREREKTEKRENPYINAIIYLYFYVTLFPV